ncbi:MAG: TolC family protein [Gemmatimonadota bacterium]
MSKLLPTFPHVLRVGLLPAIALLPVALAPSAAQAQVEAEVEYVVGQALPPTAQGQELLPMTLDAAIARALENNLDIQGVRLEPLMQEYSVRVAHAAFNPTLNSTLGYNNQTNQSTSQLDGGARTTNESNTLNFSVNQPLRWYGAGLSANFNNNRTSTNNTFATRNPSYRSSLSLNYSQPLLSGLRIDNQRNQLRVQEVQSEITDIQLRAEVDNIIDQVRVSYWNLRALIEQIEIQRLSLAQSERLLEQNRVQVQAGTMVEMELAQAEAQVASAEQALLNAEIQWRSQELNFKRLLVGGMDDPLFAYAINPTDTPVYELQEVDIEAALATALEQRPELLQQQRQRRISEMNLEVTEENARPDLNLSASYSVQGVGGNQFDRPELGGDPILVDRGGYADGLSSIASRDAPAFSLSLNFSYPLGTRASELNLEQARLQMRQSDLQMRSQELQIRTEVTNAGMAVTNAFLQLQAAQRTREAAERSAEAELTRFEVGASTNFQVVQAQNTLTSARLQELQAIINYVDAIAEFDRVQGYGY